MSYFDEDVVIQGAVFHDYCASAVNSFVDSLGSVFEAHDYFLKSGVSDPPIYVPDEIAGFLKGNSELVGMWSSQDYKGITDLYVDKFLDYLYVDSGLELLDVESIEESLADDSDDDD